MILRSKNVYINNSFCSADILLNDANISEIKEYNTGIDLDILEGDYIFPGLIDIHIHGANGFDFSDANETANKEIIKYELKNGITSLCATTMTIPENNLLNALDVLSKEADIPFINLEGPFISKVKCGAQKQDDICQPSLDKLKSFINKSNNKIRIIDIAPEVEGAEDLIKEFSKDYIISLAHSNANYIEATSAFGNGASHVTHLYNGMKKNDTREPGIVGAAFDNKNVTVELICDGIHVHPSVIRQTFEMFGENRIILISDSMRATGLTDGTYSLGGQNVIVSNKKAMLEKDGSLAGSVNNLMDMVKKLVFDIDIPIEKAIKCATENPAKKLNIYNKVGSVDINKQADIVITDENLNIKYVIKAGKVVYSI